ncbi:hypothetical protein WN51_03953 [Melipona quadrifasciata]|uniref:Uncharacterized protein n=1 Tax=Melipona quadrifasciata TaxID=166423 RepID=A0A0M8ZPU4_9HYME|nr:hypothetical protein WN51_03953 [Melipona quadrifasciata]
MICKTSLIDYGEYRTTDYLSEMYEAESFGQAEESVQSFNVTQNYAWFID